MQRARDSNASVPAAPSRDPETSGSARRSLTKQHNKDSRVLPRVVSLAFAGALLCLAPWVLSLAATEFRSDFTAAPARFSVQLWGEGRSVRPGRSQWEDAVHELREASDLQPSDPSLHQTLGNAWLVGATQSWASQIERVLWLEQAIHHYQQSAALRPRDGMTWALLANSMARAGRFGPEMEEAVQNALRLGPNEAHVHETLMPVVLEHWDRVGPTLRRWANSLFARGTDQQREAINRLGQRFGRQMPGSEGTFPAP